MAPWDRQIYRHKIARIYMPQRKHVHCHPQNKNWGKGWAIEFDSWGQYKSPLMGWTTASHDVMNTTSVRFGQLQDAVEYCTKMGWGYDIMLPTGQRYHTKKNYADNFKWKGEPPEREQYD